jgi:uncharacterized protein (DUF3820 family)
MIPINDLKYVMPFGKYKGKTISFVLRENASYLLWAHENVTSFKLSVRLRSLAQKKKDQQDIEYEAEMAYGYGEDDHWEDAFSFSPDDDEWGDRF